MRPERAYLALLALYPAPFRREYGDAMLDAFRDLSRAHRRTRLTFWVLVVTDFARSVGRTQLDACRSGVRRLLLQWVAACALGIVATGVVANALTWCFSYLYHPYLDGSPLGLDVAVLSGGAIGAVGHGVVLGIFVGAGQWLSRRSRPGRWWILATSIAVPTGVLSCSSAIHRTFAAMHPLADILARADRPDVLKAFVGGIGGGANWAQLFVECGIVATSGLVVGALTARSLGNFHAE